MEKPVYLGFDKKMTKEIILALIEKLFKRKINVIAIVSDNASSNVGCWKELGGHNPTAPYFKHPQTEKNVYIVPDAPHLLKLLRNWFIDHGFYHNGQTISADLLFELIAKRDQAELTPLYKLTRNHLIMSSHEKQNVCRAAQLLSRTTAISLREYFPNNNEASRLSDFIEIVDLWFSISNSYTPYAKLDYTKSFTGNENQKKALQDMFEIISTMRIIDRPGMQIFQKSLLMQITAMGLIFEDMKQKHDISFISTHKLNQDVLENFFSQLRQKGGVYDHPTPMSCRHRIRTMILGKSPSILKNQTYSDYVTDAESICVEQRIAIENENDGYGEERNNDYVLAAIYSSGEIMPTLDEPEDDTENLHSNDSELLSTISSTIIELPEQDSDGLEYVMGYIAYKFTDKFPDLDLGKKSLHFTTDHSYCHPPSFLRHLSVGGLFVPSEMFLKKGFKMEKIFQKLHPDGKLKQTTGIVQKLTNSIAKRIPELPLPIVHAFAKQRVLVRVKFENIKLSNAKNVGAKRGIDGRSKTAKKIRKIVT